MAIIVFTLQVAQKTLPFYKEYFNISYPLPKMDLIAIPDFAAGESGGDSDTKERIKISADGVSKTGLLCERVNK